MVKKIFHSSIIKNTFWLLSEKLISIFGLLFVTSYVAKYIGPENFGKLNISIYYYAILQAVAIWGSDTIGVKRISNNISSGLNFLYSFSLYKFIVFSLLSFILEVYFFIFFDRLTFIFSLAVFLSSLFSVMDCFSLYNEARLKSFYNVISNSIGLSISLIVRYFIAHYNFPPVFLSLSIVCAGVIPFLIRCVIFYSTHSRGTLESINYNSYYIKYGFFTGAGLLVSSVSVFLYVNISRILLGHYSTLADVGIYSVAMTLGTMWGFVNNAIVVSITPKLYSKANTDSSSLTAFTCQILISLGISYSLLFLFFGERVLSLLYGQQYQGAYSLTFFLIGSTCLSGLGMSISRFIISHNGYSYLAKKSLSVAVLGCVIGVVLISNYKIVGASMTAFIIEFFSLTIMNVFFKTKVMLSLFYKILSVRFFFNTLRSFLVSR